jgi:hypothetical protein
MDIHTSLQKNCYNIKFVFLFFLLLFLGAGRGVAQSNHTVTFTGNSSDFSTAEAYAAQASGINTTYYITFDAANLYVGAFRTGGSTFGSSDNFAVYVDTDPNASPTAGTGTTAGYSYNGVTGTLPFSANYTAHIEQSYQEQRTYSGGAWGTSSSPSVYTTTTAREITIPWSALGSPDGINITLFMGYAGGTYANAPGAGVSGSSPAIANYWGTFCVKNGVIGKVNPVSVTTGAGGNVLATSLTTISATGNIVAGTYGDINITAGTATLTGNVALAPGAVITVAGGATLTVGTATSYGIARSTVTNNTLSNAIIVNGTMTVAPTTATAKQVDAHVIMVGSTGILTATTTTTGLASMPLTCDSFVVASGGAYNHGMTSQTAAGLSTDFPGSGYIVLGATSNENIKMWGQASTALTGGLPATVNGWGNLAINITTAVPAGGWQLGGSLTNVQGNFTLTSLGTTQRAFYLTNSTATTLSVGGTLSVSAPTLVLTNGTASCTLGVTGTSTFSGGITYGTTSASTGLATFNLAGAVLVNGGTVTLSNSSSTSGTCVMNISNNTTSAFNISSGTLNMLNSSAVATGGNATLNMTGAASTFTISGGTIYMNYDNDAAATAVQSTINCYNFSMTSGTLYFNDEGAANPSGIINVQGNFSASGASSYIENAYAPYGEIIFNGTTQNLLNTVSGAIYEVSFRVLSGSTSTLTGNFSILSTTGYTDSFTIAPGATLNCGTNILTDNATAGRFYNNGTLGIGSTVGITAAVGTATGNVQTKGVRNFGAAAGDNYVYNGTAAQVTGTGLPASFLGNLTINNTAASPAGVTLTASTSVGSLTLTSGLLIPTTFNLTNSGTLTGGSSTSYILTQSTGSYITPTSTTLSTVLPLGSSDYQAGTTNYYYDPLTIGATASSVTLTSQLLIGTQRVPGFPALPLQIAVPVWNVTTSAATSANVTYNWLAGNDSTSYTPTSGAADVGIWSGSSYVAAALGTPTGAGTTVSPYTVTASALSIPTGTNEWIIGAHNAIVVPPAVPTVTSFSPTTGYTGTTLTINGTNLTGLTSVTIGGTAATIVSQSGTSMTVTVGAGATGLVSVTNSAGTATSSTDATPNFTYLGYITTANGDWATGATWLGGAVPPAGAIVTIANTVTCSTAIATSVGSYASITINSGASVTFSNAAGTLSATTVTNNGTLSWTAAGTLSIAASGTLVNNTGAVFTPGTGTVVFLGAGTESGTLSAITFNNITINGTLTETSGPAVTIAGVLLINGGNLTVTPTYTSTSTLTYNVTYGPYLEWTGNGTTAGSGVPQNVIIEGTATVTMPTTARGLAGNLSVIGTATLAMQSTAGGDIYVGGNWTRAAGTTFTPNGRAVFFDGSAAQILTVSGGEIFNYLFTTGSGYLQTVSAVTVNSASGLSLNSSNTTYNIDLDGQTMTLSGGGSINLNSRTGVVIGSSVAGGSFAISAVTSITNAGTLTFGNNTTVALSSGMTFTSTTIGGGTNGTLKILNGGYVSSPPTYATGSLLQYYTATAPYGRSSEWNAASGAGYPYNVEISNNTTVSPGANSGFTSTVLNLAGTFTVDAGSSFYMDYGGTGTSMTVPLIVGGNFVLNGNLSESNASVSGGDIQVKGNWTVNTGASFTNNSHTVTFNGAAAQAIGGTLSTTFYNLTINNTSANVTLGKAQTVSNTLNLSAGLLILGNYSLTTSTSISGGSNTTYIATSGTGQVIVNAITTTPVIVPVGYGTVTTTDYAPITITGTSTAANYTCSVAGAYACTPITPAQVVNLAWSVIASTAQSGAAITYQWNSGNDGASFSPTGVCDLGICNGSGYTISTPWTPTGTAPTYTMSVTGLSIPASGTNKYVIGNTGCFVCSTVTLPYYQGFNATTIPSCWAQQYCSPTTGGDNITYVASSANPATTPEEGSDYVYYHSYTFSAGDSTRLVSPAMVTSSISSANISFWWYADYSAYTTGYATEGVYVQYSLTGAPGSFTTIQFVPRVDPAVSATGWERKVIAFPSGALGQSQVYIGLMFASQDGDNCSLDSFYVSIPATPVVNLTANSVSAGNINAGSVSNPIYSFAVNTSAAPSSMTGLSIVTNSASTYTSTDLSNFKAWYSATSTFNAATATLLSAQTAVGTPGSTITFSGISQSFPVGTGYVFITCDLPCGAATGHTVSINAVTAGNTTFTGLTPTLGTPAPTAGATQTVTPHTAASYTWVGSSGGSWATSTNWSPAGVPSCGDNVLFNSGTTETITGVPTVSLTSMTTAVSSTFYTLQPATGGATITLSNSSGNALSIVANTSITLNPTNASDILALVYSGTGNTANIAGTLSLTSGSTGAATYAATNSATTISGTLNINDAVSTFTSTSSAVTVAPGGNVNMNNAATVIPAATWSSGTTVSLLGTATTFTNLGQAFYNVTVNAPSVGGNILFNGALTSVSGTLTITSVDFYHVALTTTTALTASIANIVVAGDYLAFTDGTAAATVTTSGNVSVTGGTLYLTNAVTNGASGAATLNLTGNFIMSSGSVYANYESANPITINIGGNMNLSGGIMYGTYFGTGIATINVSGNMNMTGATLYTGYAATGATGTTTLNLTNTSAQLNESAGAFYLAFGYENVTLNMTGTSSSINISGGTFNMNYANANTVLPTVNLAGSFYLTGGTFNWYNGATAGYLAGAVNIGGNFTASGTSAITWSNKPKYPGVFNFSGTSQNLSSTTTGVIRYTNFNIVSGTSVLTSNFGVISSGINSYYDTLTVNSGATLNCGVYNVNENGNTGSHGAFINNGTLIMGDPNGITALGTNSGNIQTNYVRAFNATATCNYTYQGTASQVTGVGLPTTLAGTLTINNSSGVKLSQSTTVNGTLAMASGNFDLNGSNNITLGASASFTGESCSNLLVNSGSPTATNGWIGTTRTLAANPGNVANLGLNFTTASAMGSTVIKRFPKPVSTTALLNTTNYSIKRIYTVTPATSTTGSVSEAYTYCTSELNGNSDVSATTPGLAAYTYVGATETTNAYTLKGATSDINPTVVAPISFAGGSTTCITFANADKYCTANNTDWNTPSTWTVNMVPPANAPICIGNAITVNSVSTANTGNITFNAGGSISNIASGLSLNVGTGYTLTNSSGAALTIAGPGTATYTNGGAIAGANATTFNNLALTTGILTIPTSSIPVIAGTFAINGGNVTAPPIYGSSSTLIYNAALYSRYVEWNATGTVGTTAGYPNNVTINTANYTLYNSGNVTAPACAGLLQVNNAAAVSMTGLTTSYPLTVGSLTVNSGGTLTMGSSTAPINVSTNVINNGTLTQSSASGGDIYVAGNWTRGAAGTYNPSGRAVFLNGTTTQIVSVTGGGLETFNYLFVNGSGTMQLSSSPATSVLVSSSGGLTLGSTNTTSTIDLNGQTLTLSGGGNLSLSSGNRYITSTISGGVVKVVTAQPTLSSLGTLTFATGTILDLQYPFDGGGSGTMTINGTLEIDANGYMTNNGHAPAYGPASTLNYNIGGAYTPQPSAEWYEGTYSQPGVPYNVTLTNSGTALNFSGEGYPHEMWGNLTIGTPTSLSLNTATSGADFYIKGNWINNGTFNSGGRLVQFDGTAAQTLTGATTFDYVKLSNNAGLTINSSIYINSVLNFYLSAPPLISTSGIITTVSDTVYILNTASAAVVGYDSVYYINGNLQRAVTSSTSYDFPVGTASNYELANITFSAGLTGTNNLTANFTAGTPTSPNPSTCIINGSAISGVLNAGYWTIHPDGQPTAGTYSSTLYLTGATNLPTAHSGYTSGGVAATITPAMQLGLIKRSSSALPWQGCGDMVYNNAATYQAGTGNTTTAGGGTISGSSAIVTRGAVPSFSDFAVGIEQAPTYALPVQLIYFSATNSDNNGQLTWATASEVDNAYFEVERSTDGVNFTEIGKVAGHGNSTVTIDYAYTDPDLSSYDVSVLYYRLKQVDVDGNFTYTDIASVNIGTDHPVFHIISTYPNPFSDHFSVSFYSPSGQSVTLAMYDVTGTLVNEETISVSEGMNIYNLANTTRLADGFYTMSIKTADQIFGIKMLKR